MKKEPQSIAGFNALRKEYKKLNKKRSGSSAKKRLKVRLSTAESANWSTMEKKWAKSVMSRCTDL